MRYYLIAYHRNFGERSWIHQPFSQTSLMLESLVVTGKRVQHNVSILDNTIQVIHLIRGNLIKMTMILF